MTTPAVELRLRPAVPVDAALLEAWRKEPSVRRFQPLQDLSLAQIRSDLSSQQIENLYSGGEGEKYQWVILADGQPAGWITLVVNNRDHGLAEVGYSLSTPYQGQGLMPRALALLLADLFTNTAIERLEARCACENEGSYRVLERLGFTREGLMRAYFRLGDRRLDNYLYALLREDYLRERMR